MLIKNTVRGALRAWVADIQKPFPEKPMLLIIGPVGSGKTVLARAIAALFTGNKNEVIVINKPDMQSLLTVATSGRPVVIDGMMKVPRNFQDVLCSLAFGESFDPKIGGVSNPMALPHKCPVILTAYNNGQFDPAYLKKMCVIDMPAINTSSRVSLDEIIEELRSFLFVENIERKPEITAPDGLSEEDFRAVSVLMKVLHFHVAERDQIFRIIGIVQDNPEMFGAGLGDNCLEMAANFLERKADEYHATANGKAAEETTTQAVQTNN